MLKQLVWRLGQAAFVIFAVGILTFVLVQALPGDMAWRIASGRYGYDRVDLAAVTRVQQQLTDFSAQGNALWHWMWDLLRFDFGRSLVSGEPVSSELGWQLTQTLALAGVALLMMLILIIPAGVWAGCRPGGVIDRLINVLAPTFKSIPHFALGLLLIMLFSLRLNWLPSAGHGEGQHVILPALTLALTLSAVGARVVREATCQAVKAGWYRWGAQKGLSSPYLFLRHGLRNLSVPVVTWIGMQFVWLVEGVVVIETLFAWPGVGHALVHAIFARDVPVIQASAVVLGLTFVTLNMLVDGVCYVLDPRGKRV